MSKEHQLEILSRLNQSTDTSASNVMQWFNISRNLKKLYSFSSSTIQKIHLLFLKGIKQLLSYNIVAGLSIKGTLSVFVPNSIITNEKYWSMPNDIKYVQNKIKTTIQHNPNMKNLLNESSHFLTHMSYNEM